MELNNHTIREKKLQKLKNNLLIIFIFALITFVYTIVLLHVGQLALTSDSSFHFSRVEEIYRNLSEHHLFTFIASYTFNHTGVGNFLFYPAVFLYPWALLRFWFNPINAFIIWYGMFIFATLAIGYYSMLDFSKSKTRSFIFAIIYTIAPYHLYLGIYNYVLGEFVAYTFLPLVFLGAYHVFWKDTQKWPLLAIGISLLLYSHLLSVYLVGLILVCLLLGKLIVQRNFKLERILALGKSVILAILLSSFILVPFVTDFMNQKIAAPKGGFFFLMTAQQLIDPSISNTIAINRSVGIVILLTAFLGWYFVKENPRERTIYFIGLILLCSSTTLIPWSSFKHNTIILNIIGKIQFPYRLNSYSSLFLSSTASLGISQLMEHTNWKYPKKFVWVAFVLLSFIGYYGSIQPVFDRIIAANHNFLTKDKGNLISLPINALINKNNYNNIFSYLVLYGETDYYHKYPAKDAMAYNQSIYNNQVILGKRVVKATPKVSANKITYLVHKNKTEKNINLPVIAYNHTQVKLNGKRVNYTRSFRGTVQVKTKQKNNQVTVSYQPSKFFYVSLIVCWLTWAGLALTWALKQKLGMRLTGTGRKLRR
ncbi:hypothetical protein FC89_GL001216 [Liquorilactobacillus ghanensis DSM 18630]|uniref:Membrane protein 6-pyruvoyl-tetrahydropterin synthase-related domain-containing protein n=1 Tax=Liquorilactobacillus ghanensis DSM 18630 TaxID=1423750 RepID=A0A0R1VJQ9_9LACO|nr:hypothetical protein FC89_GL001216 [Liquorilactobacillus ghanensis DSM 18630]